MNDEFNTINLVLENAGRYQGDMVALLSKLGIPAREIYDIKDHISRDPVTKKHIEKIMHVIFYDDALTDKVAKKFKAL